MTKSRSAGNWRNVRIFVETVIRCERGVACVDIDSVLLHHDPEDGISRLGPPLPLGRKLVKLLKARGYRVVALTSRPPLNDQPRWELCHAGIWTYLRMVGIPVDEVTNVKPPADAYFDDKAYRIPKNWK